MGVQLLHGQLVENRHTAVESRDAGTLWLWTLVGFQPSKNNHLVYHSLIMFVCALSFSSTWRSKAIGGVWERTRTDRPPSSNVPASPFSPFSPFLPSLPSRPGIPTFPSAPGGPAGPALPDGPGDPGTLQTRRGAPFALVSNSWPRTAWQRHTTPINAHILGSAEAKGETQGRLAGSQRCSVET